MYPLLLEKKYLVRCLQLFAFGFLSIKASAQVLPFHLDLEAKASEYKNLQPARELHSELNIILDAGERNLAWLSFINSKRKVPLSFTSKETQEGIPIEKPSIYNEDLILKSFTELRTELPEEMQSVLLRHNRMTEAPPLEISLYLKMGRRLDQIYQSSVRWNSLKKYLAILVDFKVHDVRGYYFLRSEPELEAEFKNWPNLVPARRLLLSDWLKQICANAERDYDLCKSKVAKLSSETGLMAFFKFYFPKAEKHWNHYFQLATLRKDVEWHSEQPAKTYMQIPFRTPQNFEILNFLQANIEDEWQNLNWHLKLQFQPNALTRVEFLPGQLPHVNRIGGDIITMDENSPLSEYNVQWAIRHEYGHTLGFLDCYLEFYDLELAAIVSYQFDTSNLMCSRQGQFKAIHFKELEKNYSK